ncbi:MAG: DUF134 domain-containing protein [Thermodesulfobacteriota bacterium]|nr:DUF134 domain-containing protein [Thermodesulfobacteriota bacterium]
MPRPKKKRNIICDPNVTYFKPRGVPLRLLTEVSLTVDEYEALRLADLMGLSHEAAGKRMGVSRATFGRIVQKARKSVAAALVNGMAIRIEGGEYRTADGELLKFVCSKCNTQWTTAAEAENDNTVECPSCREKLSTPPE